MPFTVRARHLHGHHGRTQAEASPEAAVAAYLEEFVFGTDDDGVLSLIVRDEDTGREQCFAVDLVTGETGTCG